MARRRASRVSAPKQEQPEQPEQPTPVAVVPKEQLEILARYFLNRRALQQELARIEQVINDALKLALQPLGLDSAKHQVDLATGNVYEIPSK